MSNSTAGRAAAWGAPTTPANLWATNNGVYFGHPVKALEGKGEDMGQAWHYRQDRHLISLGPNGSGKTKRLLVPNLTRLTGWSILVIDPKGELAAMTAAAREKAGSKIVVLDPFGELPTTLARMGAPASEIARRASNGFNPVAALDPQSDSFTDDAMDIAEALIKIEGTDPHWPQSAQDLVAGLVMYTRLVNPAGSLAEVRRALGHLSAGNTDFITEEEAAPGVPGVLAAAARFGWPSLAVKMERYAIITAESRELHGIISSALTQTRWLDSVPVSADLSRGAYDFGRMKHEPTTVYLILPAKALARHSVWLRLMVTGVLRPLMESTARAPVPVLFMLDEFAQLGHMEVIERNLAMLRGYGVKLWALFQDLNQAKALYKDRWESFVENAGVLQSFAAQGVFTSDHLSKLTGIRLETRMNTGAGVSYGSDGRPTQNTNSGQSIVEVPVMRPEDIRRMDAGYSVVFSHTVKGTGRVFSPYYKALPDVAAACAADPSD